MGAILAAAGLFFVGSTLGVASLVPHFPEKLAVYLRAVSFSSIGICMLLLALMVASVIWPIQARSLWRDTSEPQVRLTGLSLARNWRRLANRSFPPVSTAAGHHVLPGLRCVKRAGSVLTVELALPTNPPPGGRTAYLEKFAAEFPHVFPVLGATGSLMISRNRARVSFLVYDHTTEVRAVVT